MDVDRVACIVMPDEARFDSMAKEGIASPEEIAEARGRAEKRTELFYSPATETVWQFSDGTRRVVRPESPDEFYSGMEELIDVDAHDEGQPLVLLQVAEADRTVFLNRNGIDYASVPTHAYEAALHEAAADELDGA